jgi:C4-dicarboxylate-binding protein DctP
MKNIRMIVLIFATGVFLITGLFVHDAKAAEQKIVAKFSHVVADSSPKGRAADFFAEVVNKKTKGQVEVKVYPVSQLYGDKDEIDAVRSGNVQIIAPSAGKLIGIDNAFQVTDMPFIFSSLKTVRLFFDGEGGKKLNNRLDKHGMTIINWWNNSFRHFTDIKVQIKKPADMKGKKYRISSGGVATEIYQAFGASAVVVPYGELYTALQQGMINGTFSSIDNILDQKQQEVTKYLTLSYVNSVNYPIVVNKKWWDGIPADIKKNILEGMNEATDLEWKLSEELDHKGLEELKAAGMHIYTLTPQERLVFQEVLKPVFDKFIPIVGKDLIEAAIRVEKGTK